MSNRQPISAQDWFFQIFLMALDGVFIVIVIAMGIFLADWGAEVVAKSRMQEAGYVDYSQSPHRQSHQYSTNGAR